MIRISFSCIKLSAQSLTDSLVVVDENHLFTIFTTPSYSVV